MLLPFQDYQKPHLMTYEILIFLIHLIAMNGHSAAVKDREKPNVESISESHPDLPAPTESSELIELTSESKKSTSSSPENDTDTDSTSSDDTQSTTSQTSTISTASNRILRLRVPSNYSEALIKCLHGKSQIRTLNNISISLLDASDEEMQETNEHT